MYRVIVVDDEILIREAICENVVWEQLGFKLVGNCENGKSAKEFILENPVDVVLTDICMPYMDGMELCKFLYEEFPNIRIIVFSGYDEFEYAKKAIKYKVVDYILKPVTAKELSDILVKLKVEMDKSNVDKQKVNKLTKVYNKNQLYIKSKALINLIMGTQTEKENLKELEELQVVLQAAAYRVAVLKMVLPSLQGDNCSMKQQSALMCFAIYNITEEIVQKYGAGEVFVGNDSRVFIIFMDKQTKALKVNSCQVCEEILKKVQQFTNLQLAIGIGSHVHQLNQLSASYESAELSLSYSEVFKDKLIIDMEEIENKIKDSVDITDETDLLCVAVKLCDKEEIELILKKVLIKIREGFIEKYKACLYLQQLVRTISEVLCISDLQNTQVYQSSESIMLQIAMASTLDNAAAYTKQFLLQAGEELYLQKNKGQSKYAIMAMNYLEKNFSNQDLSLNHICNYLGISVSRFSSVFKNQYGETFMEALIRIRMKKAKELIENTDMKNYEIAEKVGFTDPHYFSISFKKATGKSPFEYGKTYRKV